MSYNSNLRGLVAQRSRFEDEMLPFLAEACVGAEQDPRLIAAQLLDVVVQSFDNDGAPGPAMEVVDQVCLSRFGDALVPVLRDVLGDDAPIGFLAHCVDGYWRGVRQVLQNA